MMISENKKNTHDIAALLEGLAGAGSAQALRVSGLTLDSRLVMPGDAFIAMDGLNVNAIKYVREAIKSGAVCVFAETEPDELTRKDAGQVNVPILHIPNLSNCLGVIASRFYFAPSKSFKLHGVTGTDGKTSVTHFIAQAYHRLTKRCGVIGTVGKGVYGKLSYSTHTTPDVISLNKIMVELKDQVDCVAMEVSSHGIEQGRVEGLEFDTAVFTNLSRDHLDYHGSVEAYQAAKQKLFERTELKHAVINIDDAFGCKLLECIGPSVNVWVYGFDENITRFNHDWVQGRSLALKEDGFDFEIKTATDNALVGVNMLGRFNASNVLATVATLLADGVPFQEVVGSIRDLQGVSGRMELYTSERLPNVVIDYAHTPKALESVLRALKEHYQGSLFCVFGCGGDRDQGKRSLMGRAAASIADGIVITDDNPRCEPREKIVDDILQGLKGFQSYKVEHDRKKAIELAINEAGVNDVVLIAGKGHEDYQIIGQDRRYFSDKAVVIEALKEGKV